MVMEARLQGQSRVIDEMVEMGLQTLTLDPEVCQLKIILTVF